MNLKAIFFIIISILNIYSRSLHRKRPKDVPTLEIEQSDAPKKYLLKSYHLRPDPLKSFEKNFFEKRMLPETIIGRYSNEEFKTSELNSIINKLISEIQLQKKSYSDFIVLKGLDFDRVTKTGLLILKFKDYPFVLKLFMENAKSFARPYDKSFQVRSLFIMGGCLRHLGGFLRIKNLEHVKKMISASEKWKDRITLPRKWFWLPKDPVWIHIKAHNLGEKYFETNIPAVYAIIADAINLVDERPSSKECLEFSTFTEYNIDPHTINFLIEKETGKIAIIDTEHFPTQVGITEKIKKFEDYFSWYAELGKLYLKRGLFTFKDEREFRARSNKNYYNL